MENTSNSVPSAGSYFRRTSDYMVATPKTYRKRTKNRKLPTLEDYLSTHPKASIPKIKKCPSAVELRQACQKHGGCKWDETLDILRNPKCADCPVRKNMMVEN